MARALRMTQKEVILFENHLNGAEEWLQNKSKKSTKKIEIGTLGHEISDFFSIDTVPPADLVCDVREGIHRSRMNALNLFLENIL